MRPDLDSSTPEQGPGAQGRPLEGVVLVALEQAVAAPYCSSRMADAGARVIKVERPEGDFARGYDTNVFGECSYFVWINRGKESITLDLRLAADQAQLDALIAGADVFLQNLAPGAAARLGFGASALRARHPRLITCDISGYGEAGPLHQLKAYDLLVQAEAGLVAVSGAPGPWGRIGVSICDITAGMNAMIGIQQALLQRARTGIGSGVKVSLFDSAAELMSVPYLQARYGGVAPQRVGLRHPSITPYGAFTCADGRAFVLSIQNEREWQAFCTEVLEQPGLARDPRFANNTQRTANRDQLEAMIQAVTGALAYAVLGQRLARAQTAFGAINSVQDLIEHPQLRLREMPVNGERAWIPAPPCVTQWEEPVFRAAPALGANSETLRKEFAPKLGAKTPR